MSKNINKGYKKIFASYNSASIRVYQAFNNEIADEALMLGRFGRKFKLTRMSWIKPSFLWMMYRSGWATKSGQERILAIDLGLEEFRKILRSAILSSYDEKIYATYEGWKKALLVSEVRCQWDPDKDIYGNSLERKAIQLGLKDSIFESYASRWIYCITDITEYSKGIKSRIELGETDSLQLPVEKEFVLTENELNILGMN